MKFLLTLVCLSVMARGALADDMDALMQRCAPQVHPKTLSAIVHTESRGRAFVISDDGPMGLPWAERKLMLRSYDPSTKDEAANLVESLTAQGHMVGIGLTQLSSRHLKRFGISVQTALEPCDNLRMGAQVLTEFYAEALKKYKNPEQALLAAISAYNTGNFENGFGNGYVQKVVDASLYRVPELKYGRVGPIKPASLGVTAMRSKNVVGKRISSGLLEAKLAN
ncbi:lytic transglycosylase domain-containing protein [Undibacterium arcticum]|uniref:lytic transglycosylase domain-containing protein n=1 Tax=Undibacterium arcticum TaxID=1762892 RepID=UPI00361CC5E2